MQENDSFRLVVRRGPQPNQTYELIKDIHTLGRDITNDIVINDPEVSRHHLRFKRTASGYTLEDLGSTNGTFVGGQRITGSRDLNRGDMIGLGETVTLGYEVARAGGEAAPGDQPQYSAPSSSPPAADPQPGYQAPSQQPQQPAYQAPQQPQQPDYQQQPQQDYAAQQGYQPQQAQPSQPADYAPSGGYAPQPPGAAYDPYAIREEEPGNAMRWVAIGCAVLAIFCCCSSAIGLVVIDALSLWYDIPIVRDLAPLFEDIASALGLI